MDETCLYTELLEAFKKAGLSESNLSTLQTHPDFTKAVNQEPPMQKTLLTIALFNLVMFKAGDVPKPIRLAMNMGRDVVGWRDDIISTVIPFVVLNQDAFFV